MVARIASILFVVALVGVGVFLIERSTDADAGGKHYWVEFDNAFGLVDGADVKIAGTRAGKLRKLTLNRDTMRARIGIEVTETGFDDLRVDARCETRPQSLIGEYFVDCRPGTSRKKLPENGTIPVEQTESTIPIDLINNIMRRPYRERFTILFSELGAGLAARGDDLNETIRRAVPALRQVDRLLAILREQRTVIRDLYDDADKVVGRVADQRRQVTRFVDEAEDTARAAASRDDDIVRQWQRFPTFLRELRPTLNRLEATADEQIPALNNLRQAAPILENLFDTLGPYAEASRPSIRSLAGAARAGRPAVRSIRPTVSELTKAVDDLPEAAGNLGITLDHLNDPKFALEKDVRAGRGPDSGFSGLESLLRYFWAQSQGINLFDANSYMLKASLFYDKDCVNYTDAEMIKSGKSPDRCRAWMGPNQPGITSPDFTKQPSSAQARRASRSRARAARAGDGARTSSRAQAVNGLMEYLLGR
jgi:virulence factor Mce-like protein